MIGFKLNKLKSPNFVSFSLLFDRKNLPDDIDFIDVNHDILKLYYGKCVNTYKIVFEDEDIYTSYNYVVNGENVRSLPIFKI